MATPDNDGVETPQNPVDTPSANDEQIKGIEYFKNFMLNYTDLTVQYIETNKLYFSRNFCDFYLEFGDGEFYLYKRRYDTFGDYDKRKTYTTKSLEVLLNDVLNDVNTLEFLNRC